MQEMEWMGWNGALIKHAYVLFPDGTDQSNLGPEPPGYKSKHSRYVPGERRDGINNMTANDGSIKPCECATDDDITDCVKRYFTCGDHFQNCGDQVRDAFTSCCLKDPTPFRLWYYNP
jgi:hypothetical protein